MSDERNPDAVLWLLRLLANHLEDYLEGDETALETLGEAIEQGPFGVDDVQAGVMALRSFASGGAASAWVTGRPGDHAQRVPSAEERETLSPEAWGCLIDLRRRGSLDAEQLERVLDLLTSSGIRPIGPELAREVAARVAMQFGEGHSGGEERNGDAEATH